MFSTLVTFASAQARAGCSRNGTVQVNDTCDILAARDGVSTSQTPTRSAVDSQCDNIFPGENLCLGLIGQDCTNVTKVQPGDSCVGIARAAGIPVPTLLANNPNIDSQCFNIYSGEVLCTASQIINYS
ncbi:hypothetical protein F5148DRAFT_980821 [Russula earlei]|uniref:Uncharacterized protein n=1 Tax=Russula earlei TaxID=71964 RepID=A0ACC0U8Y8_9AGAM|nr:hypothetical protein F5148DRAFT_980821 [Russula earlei]